MLRTFLACTAVIALVAPCAAAAAGRATVKGAQAVNLRSGPGADTAAVVTLRQGAAVQVEERTGQWALVVLDSGERGYVNVAFLEMAGGAPLPTTVATVAAGLGAPEATADPTATPSPTAPALDREIAALRERLASLEANMERGSAPAEPPPIVVPTVVEPPASLEVGPSLALAGVGFLVGFLFGTFYGQRQERNRRLRVRF
ncbi:MAG: SH3 domain-containing protein [Candidatus Binatia bacterium]